MPGETANPYVRTTDDSSFEDSLRPGTFSDFIGQKQVKENLNVAITAARKRKEPLDHILFSGLPGLGKTTLARIISFEMKSQLHLTSGPILKRPADLVGTLTKLEQGDVLFIDEIHRMLADVEEFLYTAMEDWFVAINIDQKGQGRSITLPLKRFTLVGATTREGLLSQPLRDRFGILEKLDFYGEADLVQILKRSAAILKVTIDDDAAKLVAQRSRGTPRIANRFLRRVRDWAQADANTNRVTLAITQKALDKLGVDIAGLADMDRRILEAILRHEDKPVGLKAVSVAVGEQEDTIEEVYEPYLIQQDFLRRTSQGRRATEKAKKHLGWKSSNNPAQQKLF